MSHVPHSFEIYDNDEAHEDGDDDKDIATPNHDMDDNDVDDMTIHKNPHQEMGLVMSEHSIKMASCVFCSDNLQSEACFAATDDDKYISVVNDAKNGEDDAYMSEDSAL